MKKFNLSDYASKDEMRPAMTGIYHKDGRKYATNSHTAVSVKAEYPAELEGRIQHPEGFLLNEFKKFPDCRAVIDQYRKDCTREIAMNPVALSAACAAAKKVEKATGAICVVELAPGACFRHDQAELLARFLFWSVSRNGGVKAVVKLNDSGRELIYCDNDGNECVLCGLGAKPGTDRIQSTGKLQISEETRERLTSEIEGLKRSTDGFSPASVKEVKDLKKAIKGIDSREFVVNWKDVDVFAWDEKETAEKRPVMDEKETAGATAQPVAESVPQAAETAEAGSPENEAAAQAEPAKDAGTVAASARSAVDAVLAGRGCFRAYIDGIPGFAAGPQPSGPQPSGPQPSGPAQPDGKTETGPATDERPADGTTAQAADESTPQAAETAKADEPEKETGTQEAKPKRDHGWDGRKRNIRPLEEIAADSDGVNVYGVYLFNGRKFCRVNTCPGNVAVGCLEANKFRGRAMQIRRWFGGVVYEWMPDAEPVQAEPVRTEPAERLPEPPEVVTVELPRRSAWDALKDGFRKFATAMCFI